jgi:hypothetical protein
MNVLGLFGVGYKPPAHVHVYQYVKTGVDFIYSDEEIEKQHQDFMDGTGPWVNPFAGPIVSLYRCRCGATEKRR